MKLVGSFFIMMFALETFAQTKPGTTFSGSTGKDPEVCAAGAGNFLSEKQVDGLITEMLSKLGIKNRYIIVNCTQVENCQAFLFKGKPYILYNPNFLGQVKKLNFSGATLPNVTSKDWETLTILAHELGHHVNNHLSNPLPDATQIDMELEADETAGFIIYLLGGTLEQAQLAYYDVPEKSSYTHPGRQKRLDALAKGWNDASQKYPRAIIDTDRDGFPDKDDKCPDEYSKINEGCPVTKQYTIVVDAKTSWVDTQIDFMDGMSVTIKSMTGGWTVDTKNYPKVDGRGYINENETDLKNYTDMKTLKSAYFGTLIAKIGSNGMPVSFGSGKITTAASLQGRLYLKINDEALGDNGGELRLILQTSKTR